MTMSRNRKRIREARHEHRCPVCNLPIRKSLEWYFQEFCFAP